MIGLCAIRREIHENLDQSLASPSSIFFLNVKTLEDRTVVFELRVIFSFFVRSKRLQNNLIFLAC